MNVASPVLRTEEPVMQIQLWLKKTEVELPPDQRYQKHRKCPTRPARSCRTLPVGLDCFFIKGILICIPVLSAHLSLLAGQ
jgi:hypothetical protein